MWVDMIVFLSSGYRSAAVIMIEKRVRIVIELVVAIVIVRLRAIIALGIPALRRPPGVPPEKWSSLK